MKFKIFISLLLTLTLTLLSGIAIAGSFADNGNGTVTDNNTGLMWQQGSGSTMAWESALTYCEGLPLAGYTDWRLPNIKELESITDDTLNSPAINTIYFPNTQSLGYWSSTSASGSSIAWYVNFGVGAVGGQTKSGGYYVRCVRGGQ